MNITLSREQFKQLIRGESVTLNHFESFPMPVASVEVAVNIILADIGFGNILNDIEDAINENTQ